MDIEIVRVACVAPGLSCSGAEERGRTGDFVKNTYRKVGDFVMRGFPFRQEILSFLFDKISTFCVRDKCKKMRYAYSRWNPKENKERHAKLRALPARTPAKLLPSKRKQEKARKAFELNCKATIQMERFSLGETDSRTH